MKDPPLFPSKSEICFSQLGEREIITVSLILIVVRKAILDLFWLVGAKLTLRPCRNDIVDLNPHCVNEEMQVAVKICVIILICISLGVRTQAHLSKL